VKVAVSLPDELYERADAAATSLGMNRSQLYARAIARLLVARIAPLSLPDLPKLDDGLRLVLDG
jgi:metal-responsive CopG/Arc/MetJ family transcriptional regulator